MATSGTPHIRLRDTRPERVNVGDVLTGEIGSYIDTDGIRDGTCRILWYYRRYDSFIVASPPGNADVEFNLTVTEEHVGKEIFMRFEYVRDSDSQTYIPNSGSVCVEPNEATLPVPHFERTRQQQIPGASSQCRIFNIEAHNGYLYLAANRDWCHIYDIGGGTGTPGNPVYVGKVTLFENNNGAGPTAPVDIPITDAKVYENLLFLCGREVDWFQTNETGIIACYDLTNPASPTFRSSYRPPDMNPKPDVPGVGGDGKGNNWYQGLSYNPNQPGIVNVASQFDGHTSIDISNPDLIAPAAGARNGVYNLQMLEADFDTWTTTWECSNCSSFTDVNGRHWAVHCNHSNGYLFIDVTDPGNPGGNDPGGVGDGVQRVRPAQVYVLNNQNDVLDNQRLTFRSRMSHVRNGWLYGCHNIAAEIGINKNRPARGLVSLNVADPTSIVRDANDFTNDFYWSCIGAADNDNDWQTGGDQPQMGFSLDPIHPYAYIANGERGTAVFQIASPSKLRYLGLQGTNLGPTTNLYQSLAVAINGARYQYYADAYATNGKTQEFNVYADEVTNMPFTIGEDVPFSNDPADEVGINNSAFTPDPRASNNLFHTAQQNDVVTQAGAFFIQQAGERTYAISLYRYDPTGGGGTGAPIGPALQTQTFVIPGTGGAEAVLEDTAAVNWPLTAGQDYFVAIGDIGQQLGGIMRANPTASVGARLDNINGVMPNYDGWAGTPTNVNIAVYLRGDTVTPGGTDQPVRGGVGDSGTTQARDNSLSQVRNVQNVGGVTSSIIGVCVNEDAQPHVSLFRQAETTNHTFAYIGGGGTNYDGTSVTEATADVWDGAQGGFTNKGVQPTIADADAAPGTVVSPNLTYINDTKPEQVVESGNYVWAREP